MAFNIKSNQRVVEMPVVERPQVTAPEAPVSFEIPSAPETREAMPATETQISTQAHEALRASIASTPVQPVSAAPANAKTELEIKIDKILEADLTNVYRELPENVKPIFRKRGEEAAFKIKTLIETLKATAEKIAEILREWLRLIPASGAFFAEQIVKIKVDQLMELVKGRVI